MRLTMAPTSWCNPWQLLVCTGSTHCSTACLQSEPDSPNNHKKQCSSPGVRQNVSQTSRRETKVTPQRARSNKTKWHAREDERTKQSYKTSNIPVDQWSMNNPYLLTSVLCVLCYVNSLNGDFVHDDICAIKTNPDSLGLTPWSSLLSNDFWGKSMKDPMSHKSYRPLTILTFRFNILLHGLHPIGFHVFNVILHTISAAMFVYMSDRILGFQINTVLVGGLFFATHPIHTEAVAGIVGRADVLACVFYLAALILYDIYLKKVESHNPSDWFKLYQISSLVSSGLAVLAKEIGITVLGVMLLYDIMRNKKSFRRLLTGNKGSKYPTAFVKRCALIAGVFCILLGFRLWMLHGSLPQFSDQDNPAAFTHKKLTRALSYSYVQTHNMKLLMYPSQLSYDWQMGSIPLIHGIFVKQSLAILVFFLSLTALIFISARNIKGKTQLQIVIGLALIGFPLVPASNLFFPVGFVVAERILYIPSIGFTILLAVGWESLYWRRRSMTVLSTLFVILMFCIKTWTRNHDWHSRKNLFESGLKTLPHNAKMHYNYANLQKDLGNFALSIQHYREALRLWPTYASAHNNLGTLLNSSEAEYHFEEALRIHPWHANAYFNLANHRYLSGEIKIAIELMQKSLKLEPKNKDALIQLARMWTYTGHYKKAEDIFKSLLESDSKNPLVYFHYGELLDKAGKKFEALTVLEKAVEIDRTYVQAVLALGKLFTGINQPTKAEYYYRRCLEQVTDERVRIAQGILYLTMNRGHEAIKVFEDLYRTNQYNADVRVYLAQAYIQSHEFSRAEILLTGVISTHRDHREALHQLALLNNHLNRSTTALTFSVSALRLCTPQDLSCAQIYITHADIVKDMDQIDAAKEAYQKAIEIKSNLVHAHMNLGVIHHIQGNYSLAWQHYKIALMHQPDNPVLLDNIEKLRKAEMKFYKLSCRIKS